MAAPFFKGSVWADSIPGRIFAIRGGHGGPPNSPSSAGAFHMVQHSTS